MAEENQSSAQDVDYELKRSVKSGMGLAVFAVVMTIVAIAAGIYIVIDKMTDEKRINDAVSQKCLTPADPKQGVIEDNNATAPEETIPDIADSTITPNVSDYIYVADWGVRIKKPEGYYVWYRVEPDTGSATKGRLALSASPSNAQTWQNYGDFDGGRGLLYIYRRDGNVTEWEAGGSTPMYLGSFDDYSYFYSGPQACSAHLVELGGDACQREEAIFNTLKDTMGNFDNWSTF